MIQNGDFSDGLNHWDVWLKNADCKITIEDDLRRVQMVGDVLNSCMSISQTLDFDDIDTIYLDVNVPGAPCQPPTTYPHLYLYIDYGPPDCYYNAMEQPIMLSCSSEYNYWRRFAFDFSAANGLIAFRLRYRCYVTGCKVSFANLNSVPGGKTYEGPRLTPFSTHTFCPTP